MSLAEDDLDDPSPLRVWLVRALMTLIGGTVVGGGIWLAKDLFKSRSGPREQVSKVTLIPDTPPPPPKEPPKEQKKEEPKEQPKEVKLDKPKPVEAPPQQAPLKSDEAAGDGASGLVAGAVTNEDLSSHKFGAAGQGDTNNGVLKAEFNTYLTRLQRALGEELARNKALKGVDYRRLPTTVKKESGSKGWVVELQGSTGNPDADAALRNDLTRLLQKEPPPAGAPAGGFYVFVSNQFVN